MNSKLNIKAWEIRRKASNELNCPIMVVSWKECLRLAKDELAKEDKIQDIKETKAFFNRLTVLALILFVLCSFGLFPEFYNHLGRDKEIIGFLWMISTPLTLLIFGIIDTQRKIFNTDHVDFY